MFCAFRVFALLKCLCFVFFACSFCWHAYVLRLLRVRFAEMFMFCVCCVFVLLKCLCFVFFSCSFC